MREVQATELCVDWKRQGAIDYSGVACTYNVKESCPGALRD
jgi:hypothetical protein